VSGAVESKIKLDMKSKKQNMYFQLDKQHNLIKSTPKLIVFTLFLFWSLNIIVWAPSCAFHLPSSHRLEGCKSLFECEQVKKTRNFNFELHKSMSSRVARTRLLATKTGRCYYEILGVSKDAKESEIKRAYIELAKQYHPDLNQGISSEKFTEIAIAYKVLTDRGLRVKYDSGQAIEILGDWVTSLGKIAVPLAKDVAVPLVQDVAFPLLKVAFNGVLKPLVKDTAGQAKAATTAMLQATSKASESGELTSDPLSVAKSTVESANTAREDYAKEKKDQRTVSQLKALKEKQEEVQKLMQMLELEQREHDLSLNQQRRKSEKLAQEIQRQKTSLQEIRMSREMAVQSGSQVLEDFQNISKLLNAATTEKNEAKQQLQEAQEECAAAEYALRKAQQRLAEARSTVMRKKNMLSLKNSQETAFKTKVMICQSRLVTADSDANLKGKQEIEGESKLEELLTKLQVIEREELDISRSREACYKRIQNQQRQLEQIRRQIGQCELRLETRRVEAKLGHRIVRHEKEMTETE